MQELQEDYYQILGVEETAQPDDLRKAYLKLAKKLHPDRFPDPEKKAAAQAEFARVTRAHEVLGDPKQRDEYDALRILARNRAQLEHGTPGGPVPTSVVTSAPADSSASAPAGAGSAPAEPRASESKAEWAAKHSARAADSYKRKRFQEAETAIKEAIRLDPNKVAYHCQLAEIYIARGWKTLAQTEIQTALRIDPSDNQAKVMESKLKSDSNKKAAPEKKGGWLDKLLGKK